MKLVKNIKNENAIEVIDVTKTFKIYYDKASTLKEKVFFWKRNQSEVFTALKDINLSIVKKLEKKLKEKGATVFLTRDGDYDLSVPYTINRKRSDLSRRSNMINRSLCDLYISIHLNADTSTTYHGAQVFYDSKVKENKKIAELIQEDLKQYLYTTREAKEKNDMYLFHRLEKPGVLVEIGYITNPNDRYLLTQDNYQDKVANVLTNSVIRYFYRK